MTLLKRVIMSGKGGTSVVYKLSYLQGRQERRRYCGSTKSMNTDKTYFPRHQWQIVGKVGLRVTPRLMTKL